MFSFAEEPVSGGVLKSHKQVEKNCQLAKLVWNEGKGSVAITGPAREVAYLVRYIRDMRVSSYAQQQSQRRYILFYA